MGRPREFDPEMARDALQRVFAAKGYEGTSMQDIEVATGLNKQSLYRMFGDKRGMYRAALRRFEERELSAAAKLLAETPGGAKARFERLFGAVIDEAAGCAGGQRPGCFLSLASAEADAADTETMQILTEMRQAMTEAFQTALGPMGATEAGGARALGLQAGYMGLRVLLRGGLPIAAARALAAELTAGL